jgi:hypothetical protein
LEASIVVSDANRRGSDAVLHLDQFAGHIKVHSVAAIIAVEPEYAGSCRRQPYRIRHGVGWRGGEHFPNDRSVEETSADVASKHWQMP